MPSSKPTTPTEPIEATPVPVEPDAPATRPITVTVKPFDDFAGVSIEVELFDDAFDDFELFDDVMRAEKDDATAFPAIMRRLLPMNECRRVFDTLRNETTGRIPTMVGIRFVWALLNAASPNS